jgi:hypothetical protein
MANPNIVNVSTIYGNTGTLAVTTAMTNVVSNPTSSGSLYKVNQLIVTNACTSALAINLQINQAGTNTTISSNVSVPSASMLILLGKDTQTYLLENNSLQMNTTSNGYITAICSWEQIS